MFINRVFPNLNDIIEACQNKKKGAGKQHTSLWPSLKNKCKAAVLKALPKDVSNVGYGPFQITLTWCEWNMRRDPDNIGAATKIILDAMQDGGVLSNDGWKQIGKIVHEFEISDSEATTGVRVELHKVPGLVKRKPVPGRGECPRYLRLDPPEKTWKAPGKRRKKNLFGK